MAFLWAPAAALAAPDTTIDSGPSGSVSSTSAAFTFSSSEAGSSFQCRLDTAGFAACPASYTGLSQGSHTFEVRATSASGTDPTPASRTWTVDTVGPDTSINSGPNGSVASTSATFTFSSNESPATFQCALDGAGFSSCPAGYTGLAQGSHTFQVRATDGAGNTDGSPASRTWTVDTVGPDTSINSGPNGSVASTSATFTFSSNESPATFQCALDGAGFSSCPAGYTGLAQGSHTFQVRATDGAGNTDGSPASRTWTVDTVGPDTSINSGPNGSVASTSATFTFSSNESPATFQCALDGAGFSSCPAGYTGLAQGSHTFQVRATDGAGNTDGSPASRTWTVDTVGPDTSITAGPAAPTNDPSPTFAFTATEAGGGFECSLDGAAFAGCVSPHTIPAQTDGEHTLRVRATDALGNVDGSPDSRTFIVDTTPPQTSIDGGPGQGALTGDSTPAFTFSANEPGTFECSVGDGPFEPCASGEPLPTLGDGAHSFSVRALDGVGQADPTPAVRAFTVDTRPPETRIVKAPKAKLKTRHKQATARFEFGADEAGATLECSLDGTTFAACPEDAAFTVKAKEGAGKRHSLSVRATDQAGNTDPTPETFEFRAIRRG